MFTNESYAVDENNLNKYAHSGKQDLAVRSCLNG